MDVLPTIRLEVARREPATALPRQTPACGEGERAVGHRDVKRGEALQSEIRFTELFEPVRGSNGDEMRPSGSRGSRARWCVLDHRAIGGIGVEERCPGEVAFRMRLAMLHPL